MCGNRYDEDYEDADVDYDDDHDLWEESESEEEEEGEPLVAILITSDAHLADTINTLLGAPVAFHQ